MSNITIHMCGGPCVVDGKRTKHDYSKFVYFDRNGNVVDDPRDGTGGGTAICSRCGQDAMTASLMGGL